MVLTPTMTQSAGQLYCTDRLLLLMLWRLCVALRCARRKEHDVLLYVVVLRGTFDAVDAAAVRCRSQLIRRVIVVACIRHLISSETQARALGLSCRQTLFSS